MNMNSSSMAIDSLRLALKIRKENDIDIKDSFCVYDFAEQIGIELKFVDIPSMEGMYVANPKKTILISSHRPMGRQRFTCAHELGHHFFKHGRHIDEIADCRRAQPKEPQEAIADLFASYLLMPSTTVSNGFIRRGWQMETATPLQVYTVACWLGVGYTTLINHMQFGIKRLKSENAITLRKQTPKELKRKLLGSYIQENVILADIGWSGRPIDLCIRDILVFDKVIEVDGSNFERIDSVRGRNVYRAVKTGIGKVFCEKTGWASFVRVSRNSYIGRGKFRHLEDD